MASFNVSDTPVRAKPPASSGPGSTSEARTACQQPPDSALPHTCVRTAWQTSLPHGLERCRATPLLDVVGALPARLLPPPTPGIGHVTGSGSLLVGRGVRSADSVGAAILLSLLPRPCGTPGSLL